MAINSLTTPNDKIPLLSLSSQNSSKGGIIPNRLVKLNFSTDSSVTSSVKCKIRKNTNCKSPYLNGDKAHLLSRVTEKRVIQKKAADLVSSFPLAVKIYKANSDEFKSVKQTNKRVKKSVLTLPNEQAPAPQICTVSDMNDSEDFNHDDDIRKKRPKKRPPGQNRKSRNDFEFYDRDARYCSQFNIHLDHSSTDVIRNFNGDSKKSLSSKKQIATSKGKAEGKFNGHDVWRVLRDIDRFQFRPSPPMSEENNPLPRKKDNQMRYNRKDARFIKTCCTEEFAYISSIEVDNKSPTSFSHCSSFDRVTVIDKKDEFSSISEGFEKLPNTLNVKKCKKLKKSRNKNISFIKKSLTSGKKAPGIKECNQHTIPINKCIDVKKSYYKNETYSNHSNSVVNEDSLILNAPIETQQKQINENLIKSVLKNNQTQDLIDSSEIENNLNSPTNLVSSKTGLQNTSKVYDEVFMINQNNICNHRNGITKVVLSKGQDVLSSQRLETLKRKSRLSTTLTNASIVPQMTQTNIRKRLLNMKFPLVILGRDQVRSTIEVKDYDPPQFEGLDKHIWPFMVEWSDDYKLKTEVGDTSKSNDIINFATKCIEDSNIQKRKQFHGDYKFHKLPNKNLHITACKQPSNRERKWANCKLGSKKSVMSTLDLNNNTEELKKPKLIHQLKDKMLKLLYKKPLAINSSEIDRHVTEQYDVQHGVNGDFMNEMKISPKMDVSVNNNDKINTVVNNSITKQHLNPSNTRLVDTRSVAIKRPWAKAKRASNFIETVIKNIKNGVYFNQDVKYESIQSSIDAKEASVQTRLISEKLNERVILDTELDQPSEPLLIKRNDLHKIIPGFDSSLPELEIQTLDTNKIEIKNCLANIIVQFDITVLQQSDKLGIHTKDSCSLIPLQNDSGTKLFKCKATILNAMLPAELCAILPDMMSKILHSDIKSSHSLPMNNTDSQLSTISELSHVEGLDSFRAIPKISNISSEIRHILSGNFSHRITNRHPVHYLIKNIAFQSSEIITMLPKMPENVLKLNVLSPMENTFINRERIDIPIKVHKGDNVFGIQDKVCRMLQPYNHEKHSVIGISHTFNLMHLFENMCTAFKMFRHIDISCSAMRVCTISLNLWKNENTNTKKVIIKMDNLKLDSIFENYAKINNDHNIQRKLHGNEYILRNFSEPDVSYCEIKSQKKINHIHGSNHKIKRKGFVKLYKKCKSTSNIPSEKSNHPLSKITNLDDFFQLLGSKSLSCVFDGNSGKKILSSIVTMKNWITEINSRQAVLVLLLANKKDTPSLIRFIPVLLQGIAVNRITRASELDMEIEVIEREKLNGFSQFDGISYLPASMENKDNLLEELYWIAKTTASDYQKPFDESSEKLLKSLLEKRKQLNPSYLRVMARYVGLGLLKSPTKKTNL